MLKFYCIKNPLNITQFKVGSVSDKMVVIIVVVW